jgi:hypothetical protein
VGLKKRERISTNLKIHINIFLLQQIWFRIFLTPHCPQEHAHGLLISICCCRFYYRLITPNPHNPDLESAPTLKPQKSGTGSFDQCVQSGDPQCTYMTGQKYDLTIPYFCGQEEWCMWVLCSNSLSNVAVGPHCWIICGYQHHCVLDVAWNGALGVRGISLWIICTQKQKGQHVASMVHISIIQGHSAGKVNISGDDSIGHCEEKQFTQTCV